MHLVAVSPFPPTITGIGQYGYHVIRTLAEAKSFSRLTVLAGAKTAGTSLLNSDSTEIDYCWVPDELKARQVILSRLKRLNPDLVWFNLGASVFGKSPLSNLSGMLTPMMTRRMGYPTIVTLHELIALADLRALNAPGGRLASLGAKLFTKIGTQADVVCLTMRHYMDWLSARGVNCIHIPIGAYHQPELLDSAHTQELLLFTTLAPFKGLEILLEAFDKLRTEFPNLRLTIAGTEHMRFPGYGRDLKTRFNGTRNIQWLGQVPEERVIELFRRAQIVILPYTASTGSSSVIYQAATWGRPMVASNLSENKKLTAENNLQIEFFENGDPKSLCDSIRRLLNEPTLRDAQAMHNYESIKKIQPAVTCHRYLEAFNRALEMHKSPKRLSLQRKEIEAL
jgi:glycosyltransferase involved in cell wall biosynthesis